MKLLIEKDCDKVRSATNILDEKLLIDNDWVKVIGTFLKPDMKFVIVNDCEIDLIAVKIFDEKLFNLKD
jgi:hypothetical protein